MIKHLPLILLLFVSINTSAQEALLPVRIMATTKATPERFIGTDAFGWEYVVAENEFRKVKDGKVYKYRNVALGDITRVDLQNPLQIVLFYKKFNTAVLLDNQLNETGTINFNETSPPVIADAVGLASQNRLWVYDVTTQQTGLFDFKKSSLHPLNTPSNSGITWYQTDYNYFYWTDSTRAFFMLNLFGAVTPKGTVPVFDYAQLISQNILLLKQGNALVQYNLASGKTAAIPIVEKSFTAFYYKEGILSIFTDSEIIQYKLSLPRE